MPPASTVRRACRDRKEAEDWTGTKALTDCQDPREKWATQAPPASRPTPRTLPWPKVSEVSLDPQEPPGSQEPAGSQETPVCRAGRARLSETKMRREACRARWDPKASQENVVSPRCTPAPQGPMGSQGSGVPPGAQDSPAQTVFCLA